MDSGLLVLLLGDEEERQHHHNVMRIRRRRLKDTKNPLEFTEEDFVRLFPVTREVAVILVEEIEMYRGHDPLDALSIMTWYCGFTVPTSFEI